MARSILNEFGPDTPKFQVPRITKNGPADCGDVLNYGAPTGPKYMMNTGIGLRGGTNFGNAGSQGKSSLSAEDTGHPGIGGPILEDGFDNDDEVS